MGPQEPHPSRIGVARCNTPAGPCVDSGKPLLDDGDDESFAGRPAPCPDATPPSGHGRFHFEAIDPMVFVDAKSGRALLYAGGSNGSTLRVFDATNLTGSPDVYDFSSARAGAPRADYVHFLRFTERTSSTGLPFRF